MKNIKLFIFDIDNTITTGPSIWELMHLECGTWESHGLRYWDDFVAGKFDFDEFCRRDVACWKGQPLEILQRSIAKIAYSPGFPELIAALRKKNILLAIISGSIGLFADQLAKTYGFDYVFANPIGIVNGILDGTIDIRVPGNSKGQIMENLVKKLELNRKEVAVAGDSHFDLPMFEHAEHSFIIGNEKYKDHSKYFVRNFLEVLPIMQ